MNSLSIAFIGAGSMAVSIARGLIRSGDVSPTAILASDPNEQQREVFRREGMETSPDNGDAVRFGDIVVLASKPQVIAEILTGVRDALKGRGERLPLFVSIAAGISLETLESALPGARVIRAMPNTPLQVGAGATALAAGARATEKDMAHAVALFSSVGIVERVDESLLDAVTGLSGSGPAYVFVIVEALADAGVKVGLPRVQAQRLAIQTVLGSAQLLLESGEHPGSLKDKVASPAGTTIAGLHALESGGLRKTLIDAVEAAAKRSLELKKLA